MKNRAKVNEVVNSLQNFTDEEKAEILQNAMKELNIGISVDTECTDSGKYCGFTFSNVKLQYVPGNIYEGEVSLRYMEKQTTLLKP